MVGLLITLLVWFLVLGLIYWVVHRLAGLFGIPGQIIGVFDILLVIIAVLALVSTLLGLGHVPAPWR